MKRLAVTAVLILLSGLIQAQEGIKFQQNLTWNQIKDKARAENKYIFVDAYTTWCGPCKFMDKTIFPQKAAGDFFNAHFLNVKVQMDATKNDSEEIKNWYGTAKMFSDTYKINGYPTYLFFNPQGELVHKVIGSFPTAQDFIAKAEDALNPTRQYEKLKHEYETGRKDPAFLLSLADASREAHDMELYLKAANEYLSSQKDLLTEENIRLITAATAKSTDPGFAVLRNHPDKVDAVAGKGQSAKVASSIIFDEFVIPLLRNGGKKVNHASGMIVYTGTLNRDVNWDEIKEKLDVQYPDLSDEILAVSKLNYYEWASDWPKFVEAVSIYSSKYGKKLSNDQLNHYAWNVSLFCDDADCLNKAIEWSMKTLSDGNENNIRYLATYGNLLYKTGKKEQGKAEIEKALKLAGGVDSWLSENLDVMKEGKNTW